MSNDHPWLNIMINLTRSIDIRALLGTDCEERLGHSAPHIVLSRRRLATSHVLQSWYMWHAGFMIFSSLAREVLLLNIHRCTWMFSMLYDVGDILTKFKTLDKQKTILMLKLIIPFSTTKNYFYCSLLALSRSNVTFYWISKSLREN